MEEEVSLRELILILWKGKWIIFVTTIIAVFITGIISFYFVEPVYKAQSALIIEKFKTNTINNAGVKSLLDIATNLTENDPQYYITKAKSPAVLNEVIKRLKLDEHKMPLSVLSAKIGLQHDINSNVLTISVKDTEAQRATDIANVLAEVLVDSVVSDYKIKSEQELAHIDRQISEKKEELEKIQEEYKQFLQQPENITVIEAELDASLELLSDLQIRATKLQTEKLKVKAAIETIEKQLTGIPQKIEIKKEDLISEETNPVYQELNKELELNKVALAQLQAEEASIQEETAKIYSKSNNLQVRVTEKKADLEKLELNLAAAKENYLFFINKREEGRLADSMIGGIIPIEIASTAVLPQAPIVPNKVINLALALIIGSMIGMFVVLFRFYWVNAAKN